MVWGGDVALLLSVPWYGGGANGESEKKLEPSSASSQAGTGFSATECAEGGAECWVDLCQTLGWLGT